MVKNIIPEMKNIPEGINSRLDDTEEWIRYLEDRVLEIKLNRKKTFKEMKDRLRELRDNIKCINIHTVRSQKEVGGTENTPEKKK